MIQNVKAFIGGFCPHLGSSGRVSSCYKRNLTYVGVQIGLLSKRKKWIGSEQKRLLGIETKKKLTGKFQSSSSVFLRINTASPQSLFCIYTDVYKRKQRSTTNQSIANIRDQLTYRESNISSPTKTQNLGSDFLV